MFFFTVFEKEDSFDFDQNSFSSDELDIKVMEYLEGKVSDYIGKTFETIKRTESKTRRNIAKSFEKSSKIDGSKNKKNWL